MILASRNPHKLTEVRQILGRTDIELAPADLPEPVEDAPTFEGNALIKARQVAAATGRPAIADDSGLIVDIMGAAPGIFSARWSGRHGDDEANLALLLAQLSDVPDDQRTARFVCAAVLVTPEGEEIAVEGVMTGRILREPAGTGGFGYDPIFAADGYDVSTAELTAVQKNEISHRGRAFRRLASELAERGL